MESKQGHKMATAKMVFVGSKVSPSVNDIGVVMLNVMYAVNNTLLLVSIPNNNWADTEVLYNNIDINLDGEYDPIINKAISAANKLFPNWKV